MFIISMLLFGSFRQALSIWMIVPLMMIGIIGGLVLLGAPFTFMALLGTLSLIGMVLKNAIVLVEEINIQLEQQDDAFTAVVEAAVSRVRPVLMAAVTTMLGMIPLFSDAFFASMAVVIVCGLGVATVLTLVVLPVVYCSYSWDYWYLQATCRLVSFHFTAGVTRDDYNLAGQGTGLG